MVAIMDSSPSILAETWKSINLAGKWSPSIGANSEDDDDDDDDDVVEGGTLGISSEAAENHRGSPDRRS